MKSSDIKCETEFMPPSSLCAAPSAVPRNVMVSGMTSRSINVTWGAIGSNSQNGPNFHYDVEFQRIDGGSVPIGTVNSMTRMFSVSGLQPFTNYTFRVRGVNGVGMGGYTSLTVIQTNPEGTS